MTEENEELAKQGFGIDPEIADVVTTEESHKALIYGMAFSIAASLVAICIFLFQSVHYFSDETIPVVEMPKRTENDSVVLAKPMEQWDEKQLTRHIKAFLREYIRCQYPQSADEVDRKSQRLVNLSTDSAYREFRPRTVLLSEFSRSISQQGKETFYPDSMLDAIYIKKSPTFTDQWEVKVEGSMVKEFMGVEYRSKPVITYTIKKKPATLSNEWGLTVSKVSISTRGGK